MGKVASSSVYRSLKTQYNGACLHGHSFTAHHQNLAVRKLFEIKSKNDVPVKLITLIREPISRNLSAFFENFKRDAGVKFKHNEYSAEEIQDFF
jgi:hypothetical protein